MLTKEQIAAMTPETRKTFIKSCRSDLEWEKTIVEAKREQLPKYEQAVVEQRASLARSEVRLAAAQAQMKLIDEEGLT